MDADFITGLAVSASIFAGIFVVLLVLRKLLLKALYKGAGKTDTDVDDIVMDSIKKPSFYLVFALALYVSLGTSSFPATYVDYALKALYIIIVVSVTFTVASLTSRLIQRSIEKSQVRVPATGLSKAIVNALILTIGFLVVLNGLGISITPLLTALGVGGLAVALALQDTLSNFFAGVHILVEKPVRVGDYIKLDSGEEGYVDDIGWRTTKVKKLGNNLIIIPNSKLSQSVITNFHMPQKRMSLLIPVGVSYDSDPQTVEDMLVDEALKGAKELKGLLSDPPPFVRFSPGFGDSSLDFTLICQVSEFVDQYLVQSELRKRIFNRFKKDGVEIPFPVRTVHLKKD